MLELIPDERLFDEDERLEFSWLLVGGCDEEAGS